MSINIVRWLGHGEVGESSKCMALTALGCVPSQRSAPSDPSDLRRCILLVAFAPEVRLSFPAISSISPRWQAIIENWDNLNNLIFEEAGDLRKFRIGVNAPRTWKMMKDIFNIADKGGDK